MNSISAISVDHPSAHVSCTGEPAPAASRTGQRGRSGYRAAAIPNGQHSRPAPPTDPATDHTGTGRLDARTRAAEHQRLGPRHPVAVDRACAAATDIRPRRAS